MACRSTDISRNTAWSRRQWSWFAAGSLLRRSRTDGRKYVTQNGSLNYLSNVAQGHLEAESRVIRRGRTVCVLDIAVRCPEENKLLAEGIFTMYAI